MQDYRIDFPPFSCDSVEIMTEQEWAEADLPTNHNYEHVTIGEGGDYPTLESLLEWVDGENERRSQ